MKRVFTVLLAATAVMWLSVAQGGSKLLHREGNDLTFTCPIVMDATGVCAVNSPAFADADVVSVEDLQVR